jgi:ribonucleotide reductase beta subunit family protein with ferritin-like domain
MSNGRFTAEQKRLINSPVDVNQIMPLRYKWAWEHYENGNRNHWNPAEVPMGEDVKLWKSDRLTPAERRVVLRNLGFFATAESLVANNLCLSVYRLVSAPECYAEGTEVLIPSGEWKLLSEIQPGEKVAQFTQDQEIEFVQVEDVMSYRPNQAMYRFRNGVDSVDLLVTDNHRMVYQDVKTGEIRVACAAHFAGSSARYHLASGWKATGYKLLTPFERFRIAFQADGSFGNPQNNGNRSGQITVSFNLSKTRKIERLKKLVGECGFSYTEKPSERSNKTVVYVHVPSDLHLVKDFSWVTLEHVSGDWGREFLEELKHWDGRLDSPNIGYTSTEKLNADKVQALAAISMTLCNVTRYEDDRSERFSDTWNCSFQVGKNTISGQTLLREEVLDYNGRVYCVTVPSGMLVVRYNGCVSISGNCRQYLLRQALEEAIHTATFMYICESLHLDQGEVFNMYNEVPAVAAKKDFEVPLTRDILEGNLDLRTLDGKQRFLRNLVGFYVILEGIMFYSGFAMMLSFGPRNYFPGIREMFNWIMRDETVHMNFGVDLINGIKAENPEVWQLDFQEQLIADIKQGAALEIAYAEDVLAEGILGQNAALYRDYVGYLADRRLERIGLPKQFGTGNPFPWMSEQIDTLKKQNFFESSVSNYQSASALDDDL